MFVIDRLTLYYVILHTAGTEITIGYLRPKAKAWDPDNRWHKGTNNIIIGDMNAMSNTLSAGKRHT